MSVPEPEVISPAETRRPSPPPPVTASVAETRIGKAVLIKGQIYSKEDLFLDGQVEGGIELPGSRLTIGRNGKVQANITAREVDVQGSIQGDIEARDKITIRSNANVIGNLKSASISIEDGAYFKGSIDIVRPAADKATPAAPRPEARPATPATGASPEPAKGPGN